jgi:TRAP transporter TAXI family solute receptor
MLRRSFATALVGAAGLFVAAATGGPAAAETFITIGTGGQTGVHYVVGQSICRPVDRGTAEHGIKCTAPSTGGSIANINAIRQKQMDFGVAQSDWQSHAYHGTSQFREQGAFEELRSVFSIHPEPFTVVARRDAGIRTFADLKGKRVNIGNPGSGQRGTMEVVLNAIGWTLDDFALASELKSAEQAQALADNKVDAIVFTVGHPNGSIEEATTTVDAVIVPVDMPEIAKLVEENPCFARAEVPGGMYRGNPDPVKTFGVRATLVAAAWVPGEVVSTLVRAVFGNFDRFGKLHPAFANLKEEEMISLGLSAPLHPGAVKYYKERGWM